MILDRLLKYDIEASIPTVRDADDEALEIPGYGYAAACTAQARFVAHQERGEVFGFWLEDNPAPGLAGVCRGHDFAVIAGRWIVDTWARFTAEVIPSAVIDMHDKASADLIQQFYGDPTKWTLVETFTAGEPA